jgi:hypothetical protein
MRTIVDLPEPQLAALAILEAKWRSSRAHLIREAVGEYLIKHASSPSAFGLWRRDPSESIPDGLEFERKIRDEWERD